VRRRRRRSDCPIHFGLETFGDPWTLLILRDLLLKGRSTYSDFLNAEEGIATNVLADRLTRLEDDGLVVAERSSQGGRAQRYRPTPKSIDLLPVLLEIITWSATYDPATAADRDFVVRSRTDRAALERDLRRQAEQRLPSPSTSLVVPSTPRRSR
jgi:DNA-binding HxlR family transcriptional regulator